MEFNVGDTIVRIGETRTYSVLWVTPDWYLLFWNELRLCEKHPADYVEENFVLIETAKEEVGGDIDI